MAKSNITLTDAALRKIKPQNQTFELSDKGAPGLRLRVYPNGRKTFRWTYRNAENKQRVKTLGEYPGLTLADARKQLETEREKVKAANLYGDRETGADVETVAQLADLFIKRRISQRREFKEANRVIQRDICDHIGKRKLSTLTTPVLGDLIARKAQTAPTQALKVLALLKQMLGFAETLGYIHGNPARPLKGEDLGAEAATPGSRWLSAEEIRAFYHMLDTDRQISEPSRLGMKILLLTGVRASELLRADWKDIDFDAAQWTIPPKNQKLTRKQEKKAAPFVIPLPPQAVEVFRQIHQYTGKSPYLLPARYPGDRITTPSLWNSLKTMIQRAGTEPFGLHDLRRTCRTHLTDTLDIAPHIAEKCLNHSLGPLEKVYDKGQLLRQRREALERWANWIDRLTQDEGNVRELRA